MGDRQCGETIDKEVLEARKADAQRKLDAARDRKDPEWIPLTSLDEVAKFETPFKEAQAERDVRLAARENTESRIKSATEDLAKLSQAETEARKRLEALTGSDELTSYRKVSTKVELRMMGGEWDISNIVCKQGAALREPRDSTGYE